MVDLGRPHTAQNFLKFMQFFGNFGKILCWRPPEGRVSYRDSWIGPWNGYFVFVCPLCELENGFISELYTGVSLLILLGFQKTFSRNGENTMEPKSKANILIGQREGLSPGDKLQARLLYGCPSEYSSDTLSKLWPKMVSLSDLTPVYIER